MRVLNSFLVSKTGRDPLQGRTPGGGGWHWELEPERILVFMPIVLNVFGILD